jgi:hypothetical protein
MNSSESFAEILNARLKKSSPQQPFQRENQEIGKTTESLEYQHLAYLLGKTPRTEAPRPLNKTDYQRYFVPRPAKSAQPTPSRKAHALSRKQEFAYDLLKKYSPELDPGFSFTELKKAFRSGALLTHPDRGGQASDFQAVRLAYQELNLLFTSKP